MATALVSPAVQGSGPMNFDTGAQSVAGGAYVLVALLSLTGNMGWACIDLAVAGAALTGLKLSRAGWAGAHAANAQVDFAVDAAVNTVSDDIRSAVPAGLSTSIAGTFGSVRLGELQGVMEIGVWGKSAGAATLQVRGTVAPANQQ